MGDCCQQLLPNEVEKYCTRICASFGPNSFPVFLNHFLYMVSADLICHVFTLSFSTGKFPSHWLRSLVIAVPEISYPKLFADFRPIPVTPMLCRYDENYTCYSLVASSMHWVTLTLRISLRVGQLLVYHIQLLWQFYAICYKAVWNYNVRCFMVDFR